MTIKIDGVDPYENTINVSACNNTARIELEFEDHISGIYLSERGIDQLIQALQDVKKKLQEE